MRAHPVGPRPLLHAAPSPAASSTHTRTHKHTPSPRAPFSSGVSHNFSVQVDGSGSVSCPALSWVGSSKFHNIYSINFLFFFVKTRDFLFLLSGLTVAKSRSSLKSSFLCELFVCSSEIYFSFKSFWCKLLIIYSLTDVIFRKDAFLLIYLNAVRTAKQTKICIYGKIECANFFWGGKNPKN